MKWLVDECTGPSVARWLRENGYDVYSVPEQTPGWSDRQVLAHAVSENRVVISNDKDFGELVFKNRLPHRGIVLMRLDDERIDVKIDVISRFLKTFTEPITPDHFVVLTERGVRVSLIR